MAVMRKDMGGQGGQAGMPAKMKRMGGEHSPTDCMPRMQKAADPPQPGEKSKGKGKGGG